MAKPTDVPEWATDDDFATGPAPVVGTPTKVDPTALKNQGFVPGTAAAAQIMNWLLNRNGRWAKWLDELISSDDGDDVTIARKTLTLLHSTVAKIEAANVDGGGGPLGRATLRSGAGGDHPQAIASSIEGEVYAGINSRADTEQSWLTLRGALREILGINKAGSAAPISVPNGLNVGTSFMPPAGYLPGAPVSFTSPGSHHLWLPAGARGVLVEVCGGGGGGEGGLTSDIAIAGGGGEYCKGFVSWSTPAGPNEIEAMIYVGGGASPNQDGENSSVEIVGPSGSFANITVQGGRSDGAGGSLPSPTFVGFRAPGHPGGRSIKESVGGEYGDRWKLSGGASGAGWSYGRGGDIGLGTPAKLASGGAAILIPHF